MSNRLGPRTRLLGSGFSARVGQWMQRSAIKSIQRGTITITAPSTTGTATITAVVVANSTLELLGYTEDGTVATIREDNCFLTFTNTTTITATHDTAGAVIVASFEVIEYWPGVIRSVQRGTISVTAGNTFADATISPALQNMTKSTLEYLGSAYTGTAAIDFRTNLVLVNTTTVRASRIGVTNDVITAYQVIQWW